MPTALGLIEGIMPYALYHLYVWTLQAIAFFAKDASDHVLAEHAPLQLPQLSMIL